MQKIEAVLIFALLLIGSSVVPSVAASKPQSPLLRGFDVPQHFNHCCNPSGAVYWPIGVAFNGQNLWYSQPGVSSTKDIFLTTTSGVLLSTLSSVNQAGGLAWDGTHLWVGSFLANAFTCTTGSTRCAFVTEVDVTTGSTIKVVDLSSIFAADQECGIISGLDFDTATGTLWVAPNVGCLIGIVPNACAVGFLYNVDTSGTLVRRVPLNLGTFGVAKVGNSLYISSCKTAGFAQRPIYKLAPDGTPISAFSTVSVSGNIENAEDIAFDPVTFASQGHCALWVVQDYGRNLDASLAAYQIACP
jgi:hypothetical protein